MQYSAAGLALTKSMEGLLLAAYRDVAGVWTIGYGHTGPDVRPGEVITEAEAESLLAHDVASAVSCVNAHVTRPITQNQFDALVDFVFNVGVLNFVRSSLLHYINADQLEEAAHTFNLWVYAGGKKVAGLIRRRKAEADMFVGYKVAA